MRPPPQSEREQFVRLIFRLALLSILPLFAATGAVAQQQGAPQTLLKATHGAWEVHCLADNDRACYMSQVANGGNGKPLVSVRIQKTPNLKGPKGEAIPAVIQIQAPLGVLLTAGLSLQVDAAQPGLAPYKFCTPQNCVVEEPVSDELIGRMKKGSAAKMGVISALNGEKSEANVSLSGFTRAYDSL